MFVVKRIPCLFLTSWFTPSFLCSAYVSSTMLRFSFYFNQNLMSDNTNNTEYIYILIIKIFKKALIMFLQPIFSIVKLFFIFKHHPPKMTLLNRSPAVNLSSPTPTDSSSQVKYYYYFTATLIVWFLMTCNQPSIFISYFFVDLIQYSSWNELR